MFTRPSTSARRSIRVDPENNIPPVTMRSLGDALNEKKIPWKYYGGGYNLAVPRFPINGYCDICNPFQYQTNYPSLRADHMRDVFVDLKNGALPAVSYVKPDGAMDGHPALSSWSLIVSHVKDWVLAVRGDP